MIGRCETCDYWLRDSLALTVGTCNLLSNEASPAWPKPKAGATDEYGRIQTIWTTFDFGCVQWESATDEAGVPFYPPNGQE